MDVVNTSGRRKTSIARIYVKKGKGKITINKREFAEYFPSLILQNKVTKPLEVTSNEGNYDIIANLSGGGINGQAEAMGLAISKALVEVDENFKSTLRAEGLMTRDPRMVERKKPGRKKARKKFQFSKR